MSVQPVKRLTSLEIDEVSLVDRPANQHGLVTITKRDEGTMGLYDENGDEVDETLLESGDVVFDEDGQPIQLFSDEDLEALLDSGQITEDDLVEDEVYEDDRELVGVGKADAAVLGGPSTITRLTRGIKGRAQNVRLGYGEGRGNRSHSNPIGAGKGYRAAGQHVGRNKNAYIAAGAAGTEENVRSRFGKSGSLGQEVLSELSKALTDSDQHAVISKVAERLEEAELATEWAISKAEQLENEAEHREYVELAKSYQLPVDEDELGEILQVVSKVLTDPQLETFERILNTAAAALDYEEAGSSGTSPLMGYVGEIAAEVVGKSDGYLTPEQATTALFAANDEAYLEYLSENQR